MGYQETKAFINANIKPNGKNEITGSILNTALNDVLDSGHEEVNQLGQEVSQLQIERSVLLLKVWSASGTSAALSIGEYGYNSALKKIIYKDTGTTYKSFTPSENAVYYYNNKPYLWNGVELVYNSYDIIVNNGVIEQGGLTVNGVPIGSQTRVRTANYITGNHYIKCPDGFKVYSVCYYDASTLVFDSMIYPNEQYAQVGAEGYVFRFTIAKADGTSNIYPNEIKSSMVLEEYRENMHNLNAKTLPLYELDIINNSIIEQGGLSATGNPVDVATRLRTRVYLNGKNYVKLPSGFVVYSLVYYDATTFAFDSISYPGTQSLSFGVNGYVAKITIAKEDGTQNISVAELKNNVTLEDLNSRVESVRSDFDSFISNQRASMVKFEIGHTLKDVSSIISGISVTPRSGIMDSVYAAFDELAADYPDYVTKVDAALEVNMSYPRYANGISSGDTEYQETPAYKTYLYKFRTTNSNTYSDKNRKRKLFIIGAVHGNENAAPINLYIFAKQLCDGFVSNPDYYKLRASFDIYIMPCLNGYGMLHVQRGNANDVDIDRNFPLSNWEQSGEKHPAGGGGSTYSGDSAGSEFETQLVIAQTNLIQPDICIDHHNYGGQYNQLYTYIYNQSQLQLAMDSAVDMAIAFQTGMGAFFGTQYRSELFGENTAAPKALPNNISCTTGRWWHENGIKFPAIVEISNSLNWNGGVWTEGYEGLGDNTFKVAEYTLRTQLLHYCQWVIDHTI